MSKGYMNYVAGLSIFLTFFSMVMISGGIGQVFGPDRLEEYDVTKDDLSIDPDLPTVLESEIDLETERIYEENTTIIFGSNVSDPNFDLSDDQPVLTLENGSSRGYALYRIQGDTEYIETGVPFWGFLQDSHVVLETYETTDVSASPVDTFAMDGANDISLQSEVNYVLFNMTENPGGQDPALYYLREKTGQEADFLATIGAYAQSAADTTVAWFTLFTQLPAALFWVGVALLFIALFIVLEVVLW